jgi:hypothetical protein
MSKSSHLRIVWSDADPTIAIAQPVEADPHSREHEVGTKTRNPKLSLLAVVLLGVIVLASTGLNQSPHEATAIMEHLVVQVEKYHNESRPKPGTQSLSCCRPAVTIAKK